MARVSLSRVLFLSLIVCLLVLPAVVTADDDHHKDADDDDDDKRVAGAGGGKHHKKDKDNEHHDKDDKDDKDDKHDKDEHDDDHDKNNKGKGEGKGKGKDKQDQAALSIPIGKVQENVRFLPGFISSFSVILVSEIGDKTFFIAAIMAMKHSRSEIFAAAISALAIMTVASAFMGLALPTLFPREYSHFLSILLFIFFGFRLLKEASEMSSDGDKEELEEVENELDKKDLETKDVLLEGGEAGPSKDKPSTPHVSMARRFFSAVFIQCFTMTFLAEWGDRSQIATIALAAAKEPVGVILGGILGHSLCTGAAVLGGKLLATRISERMIATIGGVLFLFFAVHSFITGE